MDMNEYQRLAARTINKELAQPQLLWHSLFGMASEVGEIQGIFQKSYQGHEIDEVHLMKELGDLMWFIAEYATANGWTLESIAQMNIDKLKVRYPEGFAAEKSLNRAENDD